MIAFTTKFAKYRKCLCGTESISFLGWKLWNIISNAFKKERLDAFKKLIKKWQLENCVLDYVNCTYKMSVLFKIYSNCFFFIYIGNRFSSVLYSADIDYHKLS